MTAEMTTAPGTDARIAALEAELAEMRPLLAAFRAEWVQAAKDVGLRRTKPRKAKPRKRPDLYVVGGA